MADLLDFNAARRARGLPVIDAEARRTHRTPQGGDSERPQGRPLDAETRRALRRWRCFEARLRQLDAATMARVSVRAWGDAERGRPVSDAVRRSILDTWAQSKTR